MKVLFISIILVLFISVSITNAEDERDYSYQCVEINGNYDTLSIFLNTNDCLTTKKYIYLVDSLYSLFSHVAYYAPMTDSTFLFKQYNLINDSIFRSQYGNWSDSVLQECLSKYKFDSNELMIFDDSVFVNDSKMLVKRMNTLIREFDNFISNNPQIISIDFTTFGCNTLHIGNNVEKNEEYKSNHFEEDFLQHYGLLPIDLDCRLKGKEIQTVSIHYFGKETIQIIYPKFYNEEDYYLVVMVLDISN